MRNKRLFETKYSRTDQVKFVEDSLWILCPVSNYIQVGETFNDFFSKYSAIFMYNYDKAFLTNADHIKEPLQKIIHKFKNYPSSQVINKKVTRFNTFSPTSIWLCKIFTSKYEFINKNNIVFAIFPMNKLTNASPTLSFLTI